ncbi:MAG TPA: GAF domain-containing protein [Candidatus Bathyarchaeia archaeon]|nr:GAF domain-containing protein [Candidatus Methylomirabilis sp.]HYB69434.1 GAF domain-containing protein [Candidatus Bathyarchaeia archaeon]
MALSGEILHVAPGYRTKSMLVVPMKTPDGAIIGVLELINCKRESGRPFASTRALEAEALPFPEAFRSLAASLASQAAVALSNSNLFRELTRRAVSRPSWT